MFLPVNNDNQIQIKSKQQMAINTEILADDEPEKKKLPFNKSGNHSR